MEFVFLELTLIIRRDYLLPVVEWGREVSLELAAVCVSIVDNVITWCYDMRQLIYQWAT